jgi:general secretion pathway protein G
MNTYFRKSTAKGFTLIEMLTVVAIIGILASITGVSLSGARKQARDSERVTEVGQISLAVELYYNACRQYPATLITTAGTGCPTGITLGSFLQSIPTDPNGSAYTYAVSGTFDEFVVRATLEQANNALTNDLDGTIVGTDCGVDTASPWYYCKGR